MTKTMHLLGGTHFEINPSLFVDAVLFRIEACRSVIIALNFTCSLVSGKLWFRAFHHFGLTFYLAFSLIRTRFVAEGWGRCSVPWPELPVVSRRIAVTTSSEPKINGRYGRFLGKGAAWNNLSINPNQSFPTLFRNVACQIHLVFKFPLTDTIKAGPRVLRHQIIHLQLFLFGPSAFSKRDTFPSRPKG